MAPQNSTVLVLTAVELAMGAFVYALLVGNDVEQPGSVAAKLTASLFQLCRDGSAQMPERFDGDINVILQRHEKARTACDQLVNASDLKERDLAEGLLDRADLDAPGEADAYTRALTDYDRAIVLAPDLAAAYWRRGKANLLYGRNLQAALRDLNEAIRLEPLQAEYFVTRASILGWLGQPNPAFADLNRALALDPRSVHALTNRGLAHFNNGEVSRALTDFDAALHLAPDDAGLYGLRSAARRHAGDEAGAKADEAKMRELQFGKER